MTRKQYDYLSQFDDRFETATKADYIRNILHSDAEKILEIYREVSGDTSPFSLNCSSCVFRLVQKLAKYYFAYKKRYVK